MRQKFASKIKAGILSPKAQVGRHWATKGSNLKQEDGREPCEEITTTAGSHMHKFNRKSRMIVAESRKAHAKIWRHESVCVSVCVRAGVHEGVWGMHECVGVGVHVSV